MEVEYMKKVLENWKVLVLIVAVSITPSICFPMDLEINNHQKTTIPSNGRYEIIQSSLAAKFTFRLDRYTGRIAQLVKADSGGVTWESMEIKGLPVLKNPPHPRFQMFTSGLAARHTFLIDTDTGASWIIVNAKRKSDTGTEIEYTIWEPFE
jgi:hypothetical protein